MHALGQRTGVQTQTWEDAGWRSCLTGPFGDMEGCSSRGKRGFWEKADWSMEGSRRKTPPCHSSGTPTIQARHTQKREKSHTDALIKFPFLL